MQTLTANWKVSKGTINIANEKVSKSPRLSVSKAKMKMQLQRSKHKNAVTTLSQRRTISCIEVVSSLKKKVSLTSVDNVVATLRSDDVVTSQQSSARVMKTLQSCNFPKCLATFFQRCVNFVSDNYLLFFGKLP